MPRWGFVIDLDRCTGCQTCAVACAAESNVPLGTPELAAGSRLMRWLQMLPEIQGSYPHVSGGLTPMMCQQCGQSPCTYVCPVMATYRSPDGTIAMTYWRCIGCRYCVNACPYTMKWFGWYEPEWPGESEKATNPDVSLRPKGTTEKCTFCNHRLQRAKEKARSEGRPMGPQDYVPACAEACPADAMVFGDLENPETEVSRLARSPRAFKMLDELGTDPSVIYLRSS